MNHAEIRWCDFPGADARRPALILTRSELVPQLNALTVAPLTTKIRGVATHVQLGEADGLREPSEANLDAIQTISKRRIGPLISTLTPERMRQVQRAASYALGFDRYE